MENFTLAGEILIASVMQHVLHAVMQRAWQRIQHQPCPNNPKLHQINTIITDALKRSRARFYKLSGLSQINKVCSSEYEKKQAHRQSREAIAEGNGEGKHQGNQNKEHINGWSSDERKIYRMFNMPGYFCQASDTIVPTHLLHVLLWRSSTVLSGL